MLRSALMLRVTTCCVSFHHRGAEYSNTVIGLRLSINGVLGSCVGSFRDHQSRGSIDPIDSQRRHRPDRK